MPKPLVNIAASVRQRLLELARNRGADFQLILIQYAVERLLYRFSRSAYRDRFILKGAMLFSVWSEEPFRATRDLDFLGKGDNTVSAMTKIFSEICKTAADGDGIEFLSDKIDGEEIRDEQEYRGVRLSLEARLAGARIPVQVDIGFGDAVAPAAEMVDYPVLLDHPAPRLRAYPRETVVAEKFQSMVDLGIANSRMKDFFDLWMLASVFEFQGSRLSSAIKATFHRRHTPLPTETPLALSEEFYTDSAKQTQWNAFIRKGRLRIHEMDFGTVVSLLREFLMVPTAALVQGVNFGAYWEPGGPWRP
jgi:predicted nucleotidyltransferase component of viral defense system